MKIPVNLDSFIVVPLIIYAQMVEFKGVMIFPDESFTPANGDIINIDTGIINLSGNPEDPDWKAAQDSVTGGI